MWAAPCPSGGGAVPGPTSEWHGSPGLDEAVRAGRGAHVSALAQLHWQKRGVLLSPDHFPGPSCRKIERLCLCPRHRLAVASLRSCRCCHHAERKRRVWTPRVRSPILLLVTPTEQFNGSSMVLPLLRGAVLLCRCRASARSSNQHGLSRTTLCRGRRGARGPRGRDGPGDAPQVAAGGAPVPAAGLLRGGGSWGRRGFPSLPEPAPLQAPPRASGAQAG